VVAADRPYYDRNEVTEVQFPVGVPARTITLGVDQASIGRRSRSRGTNPVIDLSGPPEDAAVSHTHASLLPRDDGGWELVDHGSTNGTYLNESADPVPPNTPQPLSPGDRVYVGAWTKLTLELQPPSDPSPPAP
jgi:pSer/pThr/pTyr-binding forkhead associated (FHA) protein